jgi:hypothetical protein
MHMKKKREKKKSADHMDIIVLAYFHRYGFFAVILFFLFLQSRLAVIGIALIVYATYTLFGYLFRWKHIYCSYQNMYHQKMTPNHVNWKDIQKRDVYGVSAIFFVFGVALMIVS